MIDTFVNKRATKDRPRTQTHEEGQTAGPFSIYSLENQSAPNPYEQKMNINEACNIQREGGEKEDEERKERGVDHF
jgi:hypothetical protein